MGKECSWREQQLVGAKGRGDVVGEVAKGEE